jgi:ADP-heptose:LPS heptosyltransferase
MRHVPEAAPPRGTGRRHVLVVLNQGMGNRVIAAPLLAALAKRLDVDYALAATPAPAGRFAGADPAPAPTNADPIPALWRRFRPEDWPAIFGYLAESGIDLIVNLRKEDPRLDGNYLAFRTEAQARGVACWDLHELPDSAHQLPYLEQCRQLLARHGVPTADLDVHWLADDTVAERHTVGMFLGASVAVKRWPTANWRALAEQLLAADPAVRISVAAGTSATERESAAGVVSAVADPRVTGSDLPEFDDLVDWVGAQSVVVTGDTVAAHLVAAKGGRGVGLYFSTLAGPWAPTARPGTFVALQSELGRACPAMKVNGTCHRIYTGCPAPCRAGVRVAAVRDAVLRMKDHATTTTRGKR